MTRDDDITMPAVTKHVFVVMTPEPGRKLLKEAYPEDVGCCAFVGGLESNEGDAVIKGRVA